MTTTIRTTPPETQGPGSIEDLEGQFALPPAESPAELKLVADKHREELSYVITQLEAVISAHSIMPRPMSNSLLSTREEQSKAVYPLGAAKDAEGNDIAMFLAETGKIYEITSVKQDIEVGELQAESAEPIGVLSVRRSTRHHLHASDRAVSIREVGIGQVSDELLNSEETRSLLTKKHKYVSAKLGEGTLREYVENRVKVAAHARERSELEQSLTTQT